MNEPAVSAPTQKISVSGRTVRRTGTIQTPSKDDTPAAAAPAASTSRTKIVWAVAGLVVLAVIAGSVFAWQRHANGLQLETQAKNSAAAINAVAGAITDVDTARPNRSAKEVRAAVAESADSAEDRIGDAQELSANTASGALRAQLRAEQDLYAEITRVLALPASKATPAELAALTSTAKDLNGANEKLASLLPADTSVPEAAIDAAPLARLMTGANTRYRQAVTRAQRARTRARQQNARRRQSLRSTETYAAGFSGILGRYTESRTDLQEWIDSVRTGGATYGEAYQVLEQQASRRSQLRSEFAALTPPPELAPEHARVLRIVDRAIDATQAASLGIAEYQYDASGEYFYFEQAPSWQRFQSESTSIAKEYSAATSSWTAARKRLTTRLTKQTPLPAMPKDARL